MRPLALAHGTTGASCGQAWQLRRRSGCAGPLRPASGGRCSGARPAVPSRAQPPLLAACSVVPRRRAAVQARASTGQSEPAAGGGGSGGSSSSDSGSGGSSSGSTALLAPAIFGSLEQLVARSFSGGGPDQRDDWFELEGCWVLRPPAGVAAKVVVHFIGGAFVGAAPQLAYRQFLEILASRGAVVVATPFATTFDQLRAADEAQYKFDRCSKAAALQGELAQLPVYGVGHSMGSLLHALICARYPVERQGNVLMSFNSRPATEAIPFLSPFIAPSARALGPLLEQLATSPLRSGLETVTDALRGLSPGLVRQVLPILDQLAPIYLDVAQGRQEFTPSPAETAALLRGYYAVPRNLLLRFRDDSIDDSVQLAQILQESSAISSSLDLSLRTLEGSHVRPMAQAFVDLPPEVARAANQAAATGGQMLGRLADMASQMGVGGASGPLGDLSKGVSNMASLLGSQAAGAPAADSVRALADEVAAWVGIGDVVAKGQRALPASAVRPQQPSAS